MARRIPVHPGEVLREDFLVPLHLSARALAAHIGVPTNRITRILVGQTSVSADTALRLEQAFGASAQFWINLQTHHDLETARAACSFGKIGRLPGLGSDAGSA